MPAKERSYLVCTSSMVFTKIFVISGYDIMYGISIFLRACRIIISELYLCILDSIVWFSHVLISCQGYPHDVIGSKTNVCVGLVSIHLHCVGSNDVADSGIGTIGHVSDTCSLKKSS